MKKNSEVDKYITKAPAKLKPAFLVLRENLFELMPAESEEVMYYHMPTYKYRGKPIVVFAVRKEYGSLVTMRKSTIEKLKIELADFDTSGTTIHFTAEKTLPKTILKKIIDLKIAELKK